ncbi:MAG: sigma54 specific transcriptional regulator, Fis family [Myxococcales bacterium]|nr:sigma54 specific transcriptional regulator, Fis family [Myxococcales bacterium]
MLRYERDRRLVDVRDHPEVVIGRSRDVTYVADDDRVSRRHLRITFREETLWAEDLGSRNGSKLNGRVIEGRVALQPGDVLTAGPVEVSVFTSSAASAIVSEGELSSRLFAEVERAVRFRRPLGIVGLQIEGSRGARREAALRMASRLRRIDVAGEYATGEYLFVLPETTRAQADAVAVTLAELAREVAGIKAAARAAAVPDDGSTADQLIVATLGQVGLATPAAADTKVIVAEDGAMRELFELVRRAARSDVTILLAGETGSGKEVVAAEIHRASLRANGPYVAINCASIPETLIESELFGHERGAFTGADKQRIGFLERAHGGTLLFDEIGELPLSMQAKLLRVLEERKVLRVGGTEEIDVDVRYVAATNRDLEREVERGTFRHDLFFRLSAVTLRVPALRERPRDLPLLAEHFALRATQAAKRPAARFTDGFAQALLRYPWPGNVRELRNVIERAVILAAGPELTVTELPERLAILAPVVSRPLSPIRDRLDDVERRALADALREAGGNRTHAARKLGISRRALLYKLKKYNL